jgi:hypothetical protein
MSNSNGSHDSLPEADPILTALLERVKDPAQVRETVLSYYEAMGIPRGNVSGFEKHAPAPQILNRVVSLPNGRRVLIDGATSIQQLDETEAKLMQENS